MHMIEFFWGSSSFHYFDIRYKEFPWKKVSNKIMNKSLGLIPDEKTSQCAFQNSNPLNSSATFW